MNRAERRRQEKQNKIRMKQKQNALVRIEDVEELKKDITQDATSYGVEAMMTCFGIAQHRLFGFGKKRVLRTLQYIDDMMKPVIEGKITIEDYKRLLEEEVHVIIK